MGMPNTFKVTWSGCNHTEEERGAVFDGDYNRFCSKCDKKLNGKTLCIRCNKQPRKYSFTRKKFRVTMEACPSCGELYEYFSEQVRSNDKKTKANKRSYEAIT